MQINAKKLSFYFFIKIEYRPQKRNNNSNKIKERLRV